MFDMFKPRRLVATKPVFLNIRSSKAFITFLVSYAVFVDEIVGTAMIPVIPFSLSEKIGLPEENVPFWNTMFLAIYGISALVVSPAWGYLSDRHRCRKLLFLVGLSFLIAEILLLWLATTLPLQILARVMGGLSTSAIYISGCALVLEAVGTAHVAEWMGWVGASLCVSSMLGPLLGGSVFEKWGYDAVFYVLMGLMAGDLVLRAVMVEPSQAREYLEANGTIEFENKGIVRLDKSSGFSSQSEPEDEKVPKMTTTEVSLNTDPERGAPVVPTTTTKPVALVLLSSRRTWLAIWNTFTLAALFTTFEAVLPLYVSAIWSWTALFAGLIFLPLTLPALFAPLLGRVVDRLGTRWFVFAGFLALCPLTALLRFVTHDTTAHKALLCVLLTLIGVCTAVVLDPLFGEYVAVLKDMGLVETRKGAGFAEAYGLFNAAWAAGVMGSMGAGLMYNSYGWAVMAVVMGGWCGVTALLGLIPQPSYRVDAKSST